MASMKFQACYAMEGDNSVREIEMAGGIKTNRPDAAPIEQHGAIDAFRVTGAFVTTGGGLDRI